MTFADLKPEPSTKQPMRLNPMRTLAVSASILLLLLGLMPWAKQNNFLGSVTQTGYQVAFGRMSSDEAEKDNNFLALFLGDEPTGLLGPHPGIPQAPLVMAYFLLIASGGLTAISVRPARFAIATAAVCHLLAGSALANQLALGFPIEQSSIGLLRRPAHCSEVSVICAAAAFLLPVLAIADRWDRARREKACQSRTSRTHLSANEPGTPSEPVA